MNPTLTIIRIAELEREVQDYYAPGADRCTEEAGPAELLPKLRAKEDNERGKMKTWILPTVLIVIDLLAATVYACNVDWRRAVYWVAAAVLTATVTF